MNIPDLTNALFETGGSIVLWLNVRQIRRDKIPKGVHVAPFVFFTVWGFWNLYYYPHLGQWLSFFGGINVPIANATWLGHVLYYWWRRTKHDNG